VGHWLRGEDFQTYPKLLDTDMVTYPRVGVCSMYLTILPQDEEMYFRSPVKDKDGFEFHLVIVSNNVSFGMRFSGFLNIFILL